MSLAVEANGLIRRFGTGALQVMALRGVDLALERGQLTLLMGPSGCGKSTLLAVLAGLLRPDAGKVLALDTDLWALQESEREAFRRRYSGFVFQGFNLFPSLSATQQLEIVLRWSGSATRREARRTSHRLLGELGLADRLHLYPQALSGGEKQRVAIARALVKQPALLFADEPTSALDWAHGEQVIHLLRQAAWQQNAMVLAVSHDPRIIPFADRVLHLSDGQLDMQPPRCAS